MLSDLANKKRRVKAYVLTNGIMKVHSETRRQRRKYFKISQVLLPIKKIKNNKLS